MKRTFYTTTAGAYTSMVSGLTKKIIKWLIGYKWHFAGWALYIALEVLVTGLAYQFGKPLNYILHYLINIVLFYTCTFLVFRWRGSKKQSRGVLFGLMIIVVTLFIILKTLTSFILHNSSPGYFNPMVIIQRYENLLDPFKNRQELFGNLWRCLNFMMLSSGYILLLLYARSQKENAKAKDEINAHIVRNKDNEIKLIKTEANFLQAQINPHLLFNILNSFYATALALDEGFAESIRQLSDLMRFRLVTPAAAHQIIPLADELETIRALIQLVQPGRKNRLHLHIEYIGDVCAFEFIPLVITTLVENMFKHGNLSKADFPAYLRIEKTADQFVVYNRNLLNTGINHSGTGIGMKNIRNRLELVYGNAFRFNYGIVDEHWFEVRLEVDL